MGKQEFFGCRNAEYFFVLLIQLWQCHAGIKPVWWEGGNQDKNHVTSDSNALVQNHITMPILPNITMALMIAIKDVSLSFVNGFPVIFSSILNIDSDKKSLKRLGSPKIRKITVATSKKLRTTLTVLVIVSIRFQCSDGFSLARLDIAAAECVIAFCC
ncbi:hypothetical protein [Saezia sanguinis]|uniref:hypothetical protein n=1 Tax=Saezia sanguinis TaxID=1965230 RepID=UPI000F8E5875|nr:hypothetical protein [Saezia sanguinis]